MAKHYSIISEEMIFEGEKKIVYGIEESESKIQIRNICANKQAIEKLIVKCNELSLSEVHILDVCEDFLILNY